MPIMYTIYHKFSNTFSKKIRPSYIRRTSDVSTLDLSVLSDDTLLLVGQSIFFTN